MTERPWSVTVRLDDVPEAGRSVEIEAGEAVRAALAVPLGVDAVEQAGGSFHLTRRGRDGLHVAGRVTATVRQTCVVSLEPVINEIAEDVDVDFAPSRERIAGELEGEIELSAVTDEPEPLIGNSVDLGLLATEFLTLGVDPYPRKADVAFEPPAAGDPAAHPFAALAGWNKKPTVKE
jgi:hypothetical protein